MRESASDAESFSRKWIGKSRKPFSYMEIVCDFFNACNDLSWKSLLRESAPSKIQKRKNQMYRCLFDVTQKNHSQTKIGDIGRVRIELGNFYMGEAGPGGRRRGDQAHEGESLRILRFCTVRWKTTRIPRIQCIMGTSNFVILKTDISAENWMESMENQWNSRGRWGSRSRSPLCISRMQGSEVLTLQGGPWSNSVNAASSLQLNLARSKKSLISAYCRYCGARIEIFFALDMQSPRTDRTCHSGWNQMLTRGWYELKWFQQVSQKYEKIHLRFLPRTRVH